MAKLRIGISGWRYAPWRGVFYPADLPQRAELEYASRQVGSIELNGSFYSLQRPASYAGWNEATPRGFVFAVKGPRFITHIKRLRDIDGPLANFLASGVFELGAKLGPILWQCPPNQRFDEPLFDQFLGALPRDTTQAAAHARRHDHRLKHGASVTPDRKRRLRHALEIRHDSFICEDFIALLRRHKVALVVADTAGRWPYLEDVTADFMYLRLHGDEKLYTSGYGEEALERWAARVRVWSQGGEPEDAVCASERAPPKRVGRDVYCYFDNDAKVHAPFDAQALMRKLGL
ncbi:DUF72 domain-containing protein [Frateuria sp. STR12]|uniref:DUF72 domain-containing protein n=1 Tax=Frateuria hangzhouensis TaxID=2995589 RepID=UPI002260ECD7|nr:DUF72 domain-containing protein [Frateuria sp. STR12]MCX7512530.1 DUF72 domain-containing protein [Frateuria sp. STR12]